MADDETTAAVAPCIDRRSATRRAAWACVDSLGGVLPVDYDDLTITEHQPGRMFQERSSMLSARRWEHRRAVEPMDAGSRVTDIVGVEGRLVPTTLVAWVVAHLFRHRHSRLVARFGKA